MKRFICLVFACLTLCFTVGCADKAGSKTEPELEDVASALLDGGIFAEKLENIDADIAQMLYTYDPELAEDVLFYMSSGATGDELALIKAKDESSAEKIKESLTARVEYQKASFADYIPSEVSKFDHADIRMLGKTLVLCVSTDHDAAAKILDKYF